MQADPACRHALEGGPRFHASRRALVRRQILRGSLGASATGSQNRRDSLSQCLRNLPPSSISKHPETFRVFGESMTTVSSAEKPAIAAACKFSGIRTVVDVGGGHDSLLRTILEANPKLKSVLLDLPSVRVRALQDQHVAAKGIAERFSRLLRGGAQGQ
jgi:hypothetical protein